MEHSQWARDPPSRRTHLCRGVKTRCKTCSKFHKGMCRKDPKHPEFKKFNKGFGSKQSYTKMQTQMSKMMHQMKTVSQKVQIDTEGMSTTSDSSADWKKGMTKTQQMYVAQKFRATYSIDSDEDIHHIDEDELKSWRKKAKKACKKL